MKKLLARWVWSVSEYTGVGLGRYAPSVFEIMIGYKSQQINKDFEA